MVAGTSCRRFCWRQAGLNLVALTVTNVVASSVTWYAGRWYLLSLARLEATGLWIKFGINLTAS